MKLTSAHDYLWQPAADAAALMVVLHGRGDSPYGFEWLSRALGLPISLLLLQAPDPYYDGFSWYDLPPDQGPGITRSSLLLTRVFDELETLGFASERTFLFGFSQGCLMTLEFGARYRRRLRGYVGISGYSHDPAKLLREANPACLTGDWLITHGSDDDVLPVEVTRAQLAQLVAGGFAIDYREYRKDHTIDPDHELPELRQWLSERLPP